MSAARLREVHAMRTKSTHATREKGWFQARNALASPMLDSQTKHMRGERGENNTTNRTKESLVPPLE